MDNAGAPSAIPLKTAILTLSDQQIADDMLLGEALFSEVELRNAGWYPYPNNPHAHRRLRDGLGRDARDHCWQLLRQAWDKLYEDFRERVQRSEIFLLGVQMQPTRHDVASPIPGAWGQDLVFNPFNDEVTIGLKYRWVGVTASRTPFQTPVAPPRAEAIDLESIGELSDEMVLTLLEEHAKRVVENDSPMLPPGKISVMPIILRKMEYHAQMGQLGATVRSEAEKLAAWIAARLPSHQTPKASAIENVIRKDYRRLAPSSRRIIQSLDN